MGYVFIDLIIDHQIFIKGIKEIKMVVLAKIQISNIGMDEMNILQSQGFGGFLRMTYKIFTLFNAIKCSIRFIIRTGHTKFPYATANVQHLNPGVCYKERRYHLGNW